MKIIIIMGLLLYSVSCYAEERGRFVVKTVEYEQMTDKGSVPVKSLVKIDTVTGQMWELSSVANFEMEPGELTFKRMWEDFEYSHTIPKKQAP